MQAADAPPVSQPSVMRTLDKWHQALLIIVLALPFLGQGTPDQWLFGISPEGIGTLFMLINFAVAIPVSLLTPKPPEHIARLVETIRIPRGAGESHEVSA